MDGLPVAEKQQAVAELDKVSGPEIIDQIADQPGVRFMEAELLPTDEASERAAVRAPEGLGAPLQRRVAGESGDCGEGKGF